MEIKFSIDKSERKALAQKIAEFTGTEVRYLGVPSCAYQAGDFTVSRDAVLIISDDTDKDTVELVLDQSHSIYFLSIYRYFSSYISSKRRIYVTVQSYSVSLIKRNLNLIA